MKYPALIRVFEKLRTDALTKMHGLKFFEAREVRNFKPSDIDNLYISYREYVKLVDRHNELEKQLKGIKNDKNEMG